MRFAIQQADYQDYGRQVIADLADHLLPGWQIDPENEEGIRINLAAPYGQGWFLLRMSLHEPLLVLQIENDGGSSTGSRSSDRSLPIAV